MGVEGTYRIIANSPMGRQEGSITYLTNGNALSGTATALGQTVQVLNGRTQGGAFSHAVRMKTPFGQMNGQVDGAVTGDKISGTFKFPMGSMNFSGSRVH
ncbi:hypothetical protein LJC27_01280 [Christensenellaceae bacterium OttesenSCG-928-M15]|nr:hypothetical protein [Christensenellaceae bacterium OttesenSCG-928-M15]